MALTPEQRTLRARIAIMTRWAKEDPKPQMQRARDKFDQRFYREVDPDNVLPPEERERRVVAARKAYFAALAYKSSRARKSESSQRQPGLI